MWRRMVGVVTLRTKTYRELAGDGGATGSAALIVLIMALLSGIGGAAVLGSLASSLPLSPAQTGSPLRFAVLTIAYTLIGWLFVSWVFTYVSRILLHGKSTTLQMARVFGYTQLFDIFSIIPFIGAAIAFILSFVGMVIGIREAAKLSTGKAFTSAVVGYVVYLIIVALLTWLLAMIGLT